MYLGVVVKTLLWKCSLSNTKLWRFWEESIVGSITMGGKCRSRPSTSKHVRNSEGWKKCQKPCPICPYAVAPTTEVKSLVNDYIHKIESSTNCQSENVVYMWNCKKPNCPKFPENSYIGMTTRKFQTRMSEHLGYVKAEKQTEPSGEHFNLPGHSLHDIEGVVLEKVRNTDPYVLRAREALIISKFDSYKKGLNKEP